MKTFQERFVALVNEGQITLNCVNAKQLLNEVRQGIIYTVDSVPDGKMVRVLVGDNEEEGNKYLECGDIGFYTWKTDENRDDGFFLKFNDHSKEWCYVNYEDLEECEFETITDEMIELNCYED